MMAAVDLRCSDPAFPANAAPPGERSCGVACGPCEGDVLRRFRAEAEKLCLVAIAHEGERGLAGSRIHPGAQIRYDRADDVLPVWPLGEDSQPEHLVPGWCHKGGSQVDV